MSPTENDRNLDLLGIFYYVLSGITAFISLFPIIHIVIGVLALTGNMPDMKREESLVFGGIFAGVGAFILLCGMGFALCLLLAGRKLRARRSHTFCLVMAGISCLFMPFGTVLGVFTIIMLTKPEVRAAFGNPRPAPGGGWS